MDQGWCYSTLDLHIGCASSATDCWNQCEAALGDDLVAVDVWGGGDSPGDCYCQDECRFMADCDDEDDEEGHVLTRDSVVGASLPACGDEDDEGDYGFTYDEASAWCAARDGTLASIHDAAEQELARAACGPSTCWLGLNEVGGDAETHPSQQVWAWADGSPLDYTQWGDWGRNWGGDERRAIMNCCGVGEGGEGIWYAAADDGRRNDVAVA